MRILLLRTSRIKQAINLGEFMFCEPIGLEMVAAVLAPEHQVEIFDQMVEDTPLVDKLQTFAPDAVGITSLCIDVFAVLAAAATVKKYSPQVITLVGGTQAFLQPASFFSPQIDYVYKFTTRRNLTDFFSFLSGKLAGELPEIPGVLSRSLGYQGEEAQGRNEYITPDRSFTAKYRHAYSYFGFRPAGLMGTAQGCARGCSFCLRWRLEGAGVEYFPMEKVLQELQSIAEPTVMIFDNDFLHNGPRLQEFCRGIEDLAIKKNFICYGSVASILSNQAEVTEFRRLGLQAVLVGYESFSAHELAAYRKPSSAKDNLQAAHFLREVGVDVWASFILHPDWKREDFRHFRRYLRQLRPQVTTMSPLTPFPNLPLYAEYKERLLAGRKDYLQWSFGQVTILPSAMPLADYYREMLRTNLYINLRMNSLPYLVRKFGWGSVLRLAKGSVKVYFRYHRLMREAKKTQNGGRENVE